MEAIAFSDARANLADLMRKVNEDHAPVLITNQRGKPVVLISLEDYTALDETAYLLRSPENARRLRESVEQLRGGQGLARDLIDED